jgi:hypothetical protein
LTPLCTEDRKKSDEAIIKFTLSVCIMIIVIIVGAMATFLLTNMFKKHEDQQAALRYAPEIEPYVNPHSLRKASVISVARSSKNMMTMERPAQLSKAEKMKVHYSLPKRGRKRREEVRVSELEQQQERE